MLVEKAKQARLGVAQCYREFGSQVSFGLARTGGVYGHALKRRQGRNGDFSPGVLDGEGVPGVRIYSADRMVFLSNPLSSSM